MRVLALEPYDGGSHRAFLDGWIRGSRHTFTRLGLPAHSWKWRMRHSAVTFARQAAEQWREGHRWDAIFASDMLNLAEFRGLAPTEMASIPTVAYFHENQLTYPVRVNDPRDQHFGVSNFITALAADAVWFNSAYHLETFIAALETFLRKMPDYRLRDEVTELPAKCVVQYPGIDSPKAAPGNRSPGPLRIVWAARWEHDKNPPALFAALKTLKSWGVDFRVSVLGEAFADVPPEFAAARERLGDRVLHWGFVEDHEVYRQVLADADAIVSTACHEFFGISVVEAMAAGALPIVPRRLAYPEVVGPDLSCWLYEPEDEEPAATLRLLAERLAAGDSLAKDIEQSRTRAAEFAWPRRAAALDRALAAVAEKDSLR